MRERTPSLIETLEFPASSLAANLRSARTFRNSFRVIRRNPGFAAIAIARLALGVGANTAIFSVVNGTLLRPLAFRDPGKLVAIAEESGSLHYRGGLWFNAMHFLEWRKEARSFESLALVTRLTTAYAQTHFQCNRSGPESGGFVSKNRDAVVWSCGSDRKAFHLGDEDSPFISVVGVVGDVRANGLEMQPKFTIYIPYWQRDRLGMTLAVRTASDPLAVAASVRKQIQTIDRDLPVPQFQTMREVLDASVAQKIS